MQVIVPGDIYAMFDGFLYPFGTYRSICLGERWLQSMFMPSGMIVIIAVLTDYAIVLKDNRLFEISTSVIALSHVLVKQ